jgi:hypothetical protein
MHMSNEIKPVSAPATPAQMASALAGLAPKVDDAAFDAVASGGKYLPRLQLFGSNSDAAKEGKIPNGTYGIVTGKDQLTPLGPEVNVLVISWRPKAIEIGDEIIESYDHTSETFKSIVAKSETPDSGCMYGPEYLLWVPSEKKFVTFMMGSKSARREAPNLKAILESQKDGKIPAATLKCTLIAGKKHKWHNPVITVCSTPFEMPTIDKLVEVANEFNNPKAGVEKVERVEQQRAR